MGKRMRRRKRTAEMTKKPAMRSMLLVALFLVSSPAHAVVICGEDWITFTGTQLVLKKENDVTPGDLWHRIDGKFTFRKSQFSSIVEVDIKDLPEEIGEITINKLSASFLVRGQDYYEVIGCLD